MTNTVSRVAQLPQEGFVRIGAIIKPHGALPVGRTRWYAGIKEGEFPPPKKLGRGSRISLWDVAEIRALLARIGGGEHLDRAA